MIRFWSKYKIVFFTPGVLIPHRSKMKWTSENYCINVFSDPENPIKRKTLTILVKIRQNMKIVFFNREMLIPYHTQVRLNGIVKIITYMR